MTEQSLPRTSSTEQVVDALHQIHYQLDDLLTFVHMEMLDVDPLASVIDALLAAKHHYEAKVQRKATAASRFPRLRTWRLALHLPYG